MYSKNFLRGSNTPKKAIIHGMGVGGGEVYGSLQTI